MKDRRTAKTGNVGKRRSGGIRTGLLSLSVFFFLLCAGAVQVSGAEEVTSESASTIRLSKTEGSVSIHDSAGKEEQLIERMRLFSGNQIDTEKESYAWFQLDEDKSVKLDAISSAEIRKDGKKLQVLLEQGNLFFDVEKPLDADETYHIRTSTMTMGIRGTCGIVSEISPTHTRVTILEGTVECIVVNPVTGVAKSIILGPGITTDFFIYEPGTLPPEETSEIVQQQVKVVVEELPGFALLEISETEGLADRIYEACGADLREVTPEKAQEQIKTDENRTKVELTRIEEKIRQQDQGESVSPLWMTEAAGAADTASTAADSDEDGYEIIIDSNIKNGKVTTDRSKAKTGSTVKITVTPDAGYHLTELSCRSKAAVSANEIFTFTVRDGDGSGVYTMGMGWSEPVVISARFEK